MDGIKAAVSINTLGHFCGKRDVNLLSKCELEKFGFEQADVMVLFGGSILCGADVLADAMKQGIARNYMIAGGEGHTTEHLRKKMHKEFPDIQTAGLSEADVFSAYLKYRYDLHVDFLETKSTNCGSNVTYCLNVLKRNHVHFKSIILVQDATMQLRMDAGFRKYLTKEIKIINYAAYLAEVIYNNGHLTYKNEIHGMWDIESYITLLMGEIPRLSDNSEGYGPKGKNYIAHVEIPPKIIEAFNYLKNSFGNLVRSANPSYASKE